MSTKVQEIDYDASRRLYSCYKCGEILFTDEDVIRSADNNKIPVPEMRVAVTCGKCGALNSVYITWR